MQSSRRPFRYERSGRLALRSGASKTYAFDALSSGTGWTKRTGRPTLRGVFCRFRLRDYSPSNVAVCSSSSHVAADSRHVPRPVLAEALSVGSIMFVSNTSP